MIPIKDVMTRNVISIRPDAPIYEAIELLMRHKVSGLPVVDEDNYVVGVLSERDMLEILIDPRLDEKKLVSDYMNTTVTSFTEDGDAVEICKFFIKNNYRRVPIVRDGKLVGIVSRRDIVAIIHEAQSKISSFRFA